jgi:hypothetical protein
MALIEISDLDSVNNTITGDWVELPATEAALICGGWRHRNRNRINNLFQVAIADFMSSNPTSINTNISVDRNFFYTDSGIAPIGGTPIAGHPGAYTF